VQSVDLLYWIGPDMEGFLPRVLNGRTLPSVAVQDLPGLKLRHFAEDNHSHAEEADEHDHDHDHRPGSLDAHLWLSPINARVIATKMAADLSAADPENAARYQSNLKAFDERLDALDLRLKKRLTGIEGKPYFVFHEAFDYFEDAYGLKHAGVFSVAAEVQPGAQHVAAMRARLQEVGKTCVFSEPPLRPRLAETLVAGLPVKLAELDALGGYTPATAQGYEQVLEKLGNDLAGCLESL
jgi:zinc transport system substrate-binding protein